MSITTARTAATMTTAHHCPLCGNTRATNAIQLPGLNIDLAEQRVWVVGSEVNLTRREFEILRYFAERTHQVVTKGDLYREVCGYTVVPRATRTIEQHVSRLRKKLGSVDGSTTSFQNVWGTGWRLTP